MQGKLPPQPSVLSSYLTVGKLLYLSLFLFIAESWFYWEKLSAAFFDAALVHIIFWLWCFLFSFLHIFLVMMDGWSRYQNYKRVKDQFYLHGFSPHIAQHFIGSSCQRRAVMVAASELGMKKEAQVYYRSKGVKPYHFIPYLLIKNPFFIFHPYFWSCTFLEDKYKPRFKFRCNNLEHRIAIQHENYR